VVKHICLATLREKKRIVMWRRKVLNGVVKESLESASASEKSPKNFAVVRVVFLVLSI